MTAAPLFFVLFVARSFKQLGLPLQIVTVFFLLHFCHKFTCTWSICNQSSCLCFTSTCIFSPLGDGWNLTMVIHLASGLPWGEKTRVCCVLHRLRWKCMLWQILSMYAGKSSAQYCQLSKHCLPKKLFSLGSDNYNTIMTSSVHIHIPQSIKKMLIEYSLSNDSVTKQTSTWLNPLSHKLVFHNLKRTGKLRQRLENEPTKLNESKNGAKNKGIYCPIDHP